MPCTEDKHDPRFVFVRDDDVCTEVVYDDNDVPTVTETRTPVMECKLCRRKIRGTPYTRTFAPEPISVTITPEGVSYEYDY